MKYIDLYADEEFICLFEYNNINKVIITHPKNFDRIISKYNNGSDIYITARDNFICCNFSIKDKNININIFTLSRDLSPINMIYIPLGPMLQ